MALSMQYRRSRTLTVAILITLVITYFSYARPLAWQNGAAIAGPDGMPLPEVERPDDQLVESTAGAIDFDETPAEQSLELPDESEHHIHDQIPSNPPDDTPADIGPEEADTPNPSTEIHEAAGDVVQTPTEPEPEEVIPAPPAECLGFEAYQRTMPGPLSEGKRQFPLVRPPPECRKFTVPAIEDYIVRMKEVIKDPDLYRLFENSYPNTLDTMIKWRGYAAEVNETTGEEAETDQELAYVITGDIDAMWLRDSASQVYSYLRFLEASDDPGSLASLWRGLINAHARYIRISPYCHSFQPPAESGIRPTHNGAYAHNRPMPPYDPVRVFDCKWELDSLASFLQISAGYYAKTGDLDFFGRYGWVEAVQAAVKAAGAMREGTYDEEGKVLPSAWTFTGWTNRGSETLTNDGLGNPVRSNGMVRTAFRPSDDATIFQLLVPANMMWAKYLEEASLIMERLPGDLPARLTAEMREFAVGVRRGIDKDAVVPHREFGDIFAYECDGYGGVNLMDDSNVPSLLAMPLFGYAESSLELPEDLRRRDLAQVYRNTRRFALSGANPYFARGPAISAVGGPHLGPGKAWPMAAIVAALTAYEPDAGLEGEEEVREEVGRQLGMVLDSTSGAGVVHESVNSWNEKDFTRSWFGWANGLLGELILKIEERDQGAPDGGLLGRSWQ
ncbi:DUF1237-domain-containing protein [Pleurostoma richardsiae]|uniref:DUF1237-domain-containing protein n=1 Tax=Pleurostoma richardsiae TaxID=41990 RepID=A0AA38W0Q6_9PEZI|nr:DUF1237-domain-containing protein [Pleurostoma richardsiae]